MAPSEQGDHEELLLGEYHHADQLSSWLEAESKCWQAGHVLGFATGGATFIAGTVCLFFPGWSSSAFLSALLYTIGSFGFLSVDLQELLTFTRESKALRCNIAMSATGSSLYVLGSIGFFPTVYARSPLLGVWGFILGSAVIGTSQLWKTLRILSAPTGKLKPSLLWTSADAFTACGVETSACLGAWCFFWGTLLFNRGPLEGADSVEGEVLQIWTAGSAWFTLGSMFLAIRHFGMGVV